MVKESSNFEIVLYLLLIILVIDTRKHSGNVTGIHSDHKMLCFLEAYLCFYDPPFVFSKLDSM
jgi:hypothetical protein